MNDETYDPTDPKEQELTNEARARAHEPTPHVQPVDEEGNPLPDDVKDGLVAPDDEPAGSEAEDE